MRSGSSMRSLGITLALTLTLFSTAALADIISGFTEKVSPDGQTNATEPSVAVDRREVGPIMTPGCDSYARCRSAGFSVIPGA